MKYLIILTIFLAGCKWNVPAYKEYRGTVEDKLIVPQDREAKYYVVFRPDSINRNISVDVDFDTYINLTKGQKITFNLTKDDLR